MRATATRCCPAWPRPSPDWPSSSRAEWPSSAADLDARRRGPRGPCPVPQPRSRARPTTASSRQARPPATTAQAQIDAARAAWREGFVADAICAYLKDAEVWTSRVSATGASWRARTWRAWSATYEAPLRYDYHGWTVHKTAPWGQGPVLLQALAILKGIDLGAMDPMGDDFRPYGDRGDEARLRRPRGLLRRPGPFRDPDRAPALRRLRRRARGS